ncbi:hypothetical protein KJI95_15375 [Shewanella sp. JM162201]|uniref:Uncharacterized protein n=1 Tax=Shewanella jiangmenensis TaxID=2837387 RepID=A0ABS5V7U9_9GAMM|nr:hypothetical protein [Shewanella jiangmenensis]MBT1445886.1 hypothetical protein [Shewanella jiangmenensis]
MAITELIGKHRNSLSGKYRKSTDKSTNKRTSRAAQELRAAFLLPFFNALLLLSALPKSGFTFAEVMLDSSARVRMGVVFALLIRELSSLLLIAALVPVNLNYQSQLTDSN